MTWDLQLDTASWRGVDFEVERLDDNLVRRIREYSYPWRDGADLDDLGREPRRTQLTAHFRGDTYEGDLSAFLQLVDAGKAGTFHHPTLGSWTARVTVSSIVHTHEDRDAAVVQMEVIEDGTSTSLPVLFSLEALEADVETEAVAVTAANTPSYAEVTDAVTAARAFVAAAQSRAAQITSEVNQVRKKIDAAVEKARELTDVQNYQLVRSLKRLAYSCQKLGTRVRAAKPVVLEREIPVEMPLVVLAHKLYGDASRATEIQVANRVRNPFLAPAGVQLKVYST